MNAHVEATCGMWRAPAAIVASVLLLTSLCVVALFGSVTNGFHFVMGTRVLSSEQMVVEPMVPAEIEFHHEFVLSNLGFRDYKLVGADVSCPCAIAESLPLLLPAGKDTTFGITMTPPSSAIGKRYVATVTAFLDVPHEPITFTLAAELVGPARVPMVQ